jgi:hypothetical protein
LQLSEIEECLLGTTGSTTLSIFPNTAFLIVSFMPNLAPSVRTIPTVTSETISLSLFFTENDNTGSVTTSTEIFPLGDKTVYSLPQRDDESKHINPKTDNIFFIGIIFCSYLPDEPQGFCIVCP